MPALARLPALEARGGDGIAAGAVNQLAIQYVGEESDGRHRANPEQERPLHEIGLYIADLARESDLQTLEAVAHHSKGGENLPLSLCGLVALHDQLVHQSHDVLPGLSTQYVMQFPREPRR